MLKVRHDSITFDSTWLFVSVQIVKSRRTSGEGAR